MTVPVISRQSRRGAASLTAAAFVALTMGLSACSSPNTADQDVGLVEGTFEPMAMAEVPAPDGTPVADAVTVGETSSRSYVIEGQDPEAALRTYVDLATTHGWIVTVEPAAVGDDVFSAELSKDATALTVSTSSKRKSTDPDGEAAELDLEASGSS